LHCGLGGRRRRRRRRRRKYVYQEARKEPLYPLLSRRPQLLLAAAALVVGVCRGNQQASGIHDEDNVLQRFWYGLVQLIAPVHVHEPVEQVEHLDPQDPDVRGLPFPSLEMHERLAQQRGGPQAALGHAHGVAQEHLWLEQLVEQREDDAVEELLHLVVLYALDGYVRAKHDALQLHVVRQGKGELVKPLTDVLDIEDAVIEGGIASEMTPESLAASNKAGGGAASAKV